MNKSDIHIYNVHRKGILANGNYLHELVLFIFRVIISSKLAENFPGKNTNFRFL